MANKKDEMFSLERKGDEVIPAPPFMEETPAVEESTVAQPVDEIQMIRAENAALRKMLEDIQMQLRAKVDAPVATVAEKPAVLDESRPFAKTRTSSGGVTFEQDGVTFNARGVLMANKE